MHKSLFILTATVFSLSACASYQNNPNTYENAAKGAVIGAVAGAVIGNNTGDGDAEQGAVVGAVIGAAAGAYDGCKEDGNCETERRRSRRY